MSDFDKFFAEKLEEEAHYPGRAKNWRSLNQRLDAFVTGTSVGSAVGSVAWKAVSVVLLATTALLVWKYATLQKEHGQMQQQQQKLEQQIAELQRPAAQQPEPQQGVDQQMAELRQPAAQQPGPQQGVDQQMAELRQPAQQPKQQQSLERQIADLQQQLAQQLRQQRNLEQQIAELQRPAVQQPKQQQSLERQIAELQQQLAQQVAQQLAQQRNLEQQVAELQRPATQQPTPTGSAVAQSDAPPAAPQGTSVPPAFPEKKDSTAAAAQAAAAPPVFPEKKDSVGDAERAAAMPPPSPLGPPSAPLDTSSKLAQATTPLPIIKPLRERFQLRAGIGALVGWERPDQQGISLITGQGISASLSLWRSGLWLTTGADWVRFEEKSSKYWPEFHHSPQPPKSPKPGPGPNPHDELISVESQQRQQRYHLGLRYQLPRMLGLRPTLQAGHVWARTAPTFVQYIFDDHDPGGPNPNPNHKLDFLTQKEEARKHQNIWQAGLGLEYDLQAWTLSLRADYQAQAKAARPTFDAMFLRAGLEYSIR